MSNSTIKADRVVRAPVLAFGGFSDDALVPRFCLREPSAMHVPDKVRRSVIFIGSKNEHGKFIPRATAFLVHTHSKGDDVAFPHLVTAEHVISGMQTKGLEIYARFNLRPEIAEQGGDDAAVMPIKADWYFHPDSSKQQTDVAVAPLGLNLDLADHDYMPLFEYPWTELDPGSHFKPRPPGLGDEVFIVGLFRSHYGQNRNRPIIRIGNIAALPEEPVYTKYAGYVDAYLIEARSISGLSGSPVFAETDQKPTFTFHFTPDPRLRGPDPDDVQWPNYHFLGLMHGHFDLESLTEDSVVDDANGSPGINSGIGVVIPAAKVFETLYQSELKDLRARKIAEAREKSGATSDANLDEVAAPARPAPGFPCLQDTDAAFCLPLELVPRSGIEPAWPVLQTGALTTYAS